MSADAVDIQQELQDAHATGGGNGIVGSTTGVQDVIYWTFWKLRPPPKRKKEVRTA
jgi:hypothetical protein